MKVAIIIIIITNYDYYIFIKVEQCIEVNSTIDLMLKN